MRTAFDADPEDLHPNARDFLDGVRKHGWMALHIYADETTPSFTYTTGLCLTRRLPELIVFSLDMGRAHAAVKTIIKEAERGNRLPVGRPISGLFDTVDVFLFATDKDKHAEYMLRSVWFYDDAAFACEQLVLPDNDGRFPWEEDCDPAFRTVQPDLTEAGWLASMAR
jgi:Domain of unknown function (DUF4262)